MIRLIGGAVAVGMLVSLGLVSAAAAQSGGIGGRPANPDPKNPRTQSIFIYTLKRGATKTDQVRISNNSSKTQTIELGVVDAIVTNTGSFSCRQNSEEKTDIASTIQLAETEVTLEPKQNREIDFTVTMPETADVGEHNACLVFQSKQDDVEAKYDIAEVKTAPPSEVAVAFVTSSGTPLVAPSFSLAAKNLLNSCQSATGSIATNTQRIRVSQTGPATSWSVSIAPTNGSTASWQRVDSGAAYDFDDPSGSPAGCGSGSDGDGLAGRMTINPSGMTRTPQSGCTVTGTSLGGSASFSSTVQAITIASGSTSAQSNCFRDFYGGSISQMIPPSQPAGQYKIDMTVTAVMQ